jgi:hypothetical protein
MILKKKIIDGKRLMVARYGRYEIRAVAKARYNHYWETASAMKRLCLNAGFFPKDKKLLERFADIYIQSTRQADIFCAWHFRDGFWDIEEKIFKRSCPGATLTDIGTLRFIEFEHPWTSALEGKDVLIIHPFIDTIKKQYVQRRHLFPGDEYLPEFRNLKTLRAVQSSAGNTVSYQTWFDALKSMKNEMSSISFDVALIGAGAYSLPLAEHAKTIGRQGIQMGGFTQLLFGIMGSRWDDGRYESVVNDYWTRPDAHERPPKAEQVENSAYW